ncbi:MAG: MGMT family protein [Candidatus Coatesbacteria bacterium]
MTAFRLPAGTGTPFQRRVWTLALTIPRGRVRTYGWMAARLHSSPRAVGQALKANPFAPRVPCHRIVAADGIGGYGGRWNSEKKRRLLAREGVVVPRP